MSNYTVLHCHTMLSNGVTNIDSVNSYEDYINKAIECNMTAIALSEHGNFFNWKKKKDACEKAGLKYIHAQEFYITESIDIDNLVRDNYHCLLIAKNKAGFEELNRLSGIAFNREDGHFYFTPRITFDELISTSNNVIVSSACLGGIFAKGAADLKNKFWQFYMNNKDRCYLEIAQHQGEQQKEYNALLYELHKKYGLSMIVGTDTHCLDETYSDGRKVLQTSKDIHFDNEDDFDLVWRTYDDLVEMFATQGVIPQEDVLEALENTNRIANMIEPFEVDTTFKYPVLYNNSSEVLMQKIDEGMEWRGINDKSNVQEYKDRIEYELKAITHNHSEAFFLLEEMYKSKLREQGVDCGYSRGSCSGSLICYLLGITAVDPVEWHLNFDRFMNIERVSLADIDTDWFDTDRDKVRDLLYAYEGLHCSEIITFNTIALKGAIRDVCKGLYKNDDKINYLKLSNNICDNVELNEDKMRAEYPDIFKYVDIVQGTIVSIGTHPSAVIVSPTPLEGDVGLCTVKGNPRPVSQLNMKEIDSMNYVKLDVLGLDTVGLINQTCDLVGIDRLIPSNTDYNDLAVWKDIRDDNTLIFQWESDSAKAYLQQLFSDSTVEKIKKLNPNFSYLDLLSVGNGAIRPAGASYRDELAQGIYRDNGHESLNKLLASTLGYLVYQEQIINFLHQFCGFTMGEADVVRRGFAKKTGTEQFIPRIKEGFAKTMLEEYNVSHEESDKLITNFIQVIEDASSYLFSENHALPYSMLGYAIGWLRYYYPIETLTTALNIYQSDSKKSEQITNYTLSKGISILSPKFGKSKAQFFMDKEHNSIYKGVGSIKDMNAEIADNLYNLSHAGEIHDIFDILCKPTAEVGNRKQLRKLIKIGYFEQFGDINTLLYAQRIYDTYGKRKTLKKPFEYNIEGLFTKETEKQYSGIDSIGVCKVVLNNTTIPKLPKREGIAYQLCIMGYSSECIPDEPINHFAVQSLITTKYNTYFRLYRLYDGEIIEVKVDKKYFESHPIDMKAFEKEFDKVPILKCSFTSKQKRRKIDDKWVATGEYESILSAYTEI